MKFIETIEHLEKVYSAPSGASIIKVCSKLTPGHRSWVEHSKLCILSTVGPEGTDASPRGDEEPVARILDDETLAIPDWRGNNRIDSLRNIVRDKRVSLMFFVGGSNNVIRVNGHAYVTIEREVIQKLSRKNASPRSVIIVKIGEVYSQCARALIRANHWNERPDLTTLPTIGELLKEAANGDFDAQTYDKEWTARAAKTMWSAE
jgi:hypothetical protein